MSSGDAELFMSRPSTSKASGALYCYSSTRNRAAICGQLMDNFAFVEQAGWQAAHERGWHAAHKHGLDGALCLLKGGAPWRLPQ